MHFRTTVARRVLASLTIACSLAAAAAAQQEPLNDIKDGVYLSTDAAWSIFEAALVSVDRPACQIKIRFARIADGPGVAQGAASDPRRFLLGHVEAQEGLPAGDEYLRVGPDGSFDYVSEPVDVTLRFRFAGPLISGTSPEAGAPQVDFPQAWLARIANAAGHGKLERPDESGSGKHEVELAGGVLTFTDFSRQGVATTRLVIQVLEGRTLVAQSDPVLSGRLESMTAREALNAAGNEVGTWLLHLPN